MEKKTFRRWNHVVAVVVFAISAFTYLSTIEPTASFWDCGEFIASSYKLEVGHPPGNPVFQLIARFFTMFGDGSHAAVLVNSMSGICSALTIFLLYLTIVFFAKRLVLGKREDAPTLGESIAIFGSGAVGALAYCFSDTFWFSAVEGEVYAMSSLFTALVVWAMTKWYEDEDRSHANRWIVLISLLMGLSIGVHLLNLLAIPMLVFLYFFKQREDKPYSFWEYVKIFAIAVVLLAFILFFIVPWVPKLAAYFDLFFVNTLGLPYNSGAAFFMIGLLALCFWGLLKSHKNQKVLYHTALLCFTTILIGFSVFSIIIIRSSAKTPTNEYQPDNAFTLVRYLSREQYGSAPLIYGQYFGAPYDVNQKTYWAPVNGKYKSVPSPLDVKYSSEGKMLFPRMWSSDESHVRYYESYTQGKGRAIPGAEYKKPSFGSNLAYFFDFQLGWMYWRYFMWNFAGRQNDIHAPTQNYMTGNWECGIKPIDNMRLGDHSSAPEWVANNKGKNHYYLLPLLLGILGLVFQFDKDRRGLWLTFLLFFMTGVAIVLYLNQPPYQVRERDYAYAGSFYAFSIWIGLGAMAIYSWIASTIKSKKTTAVAVASVAACLFVPALMAEENWDDHDRSNRFTSTEVAKNYLNSVGQNGLLITHGDNDTFPLWYVQEVENFRTDVRICNTSLLGTDWYIDQMKYAFNESKPLDFSIGQDQYLYGTNEWVPIQDSRNQTFLLSDLIQVFKHPDARIETQDGRKINYWPSRKMVVPVNKENVIKSGILSAEYADSIPDAIVLEIPKSKTYLTKPELFMLDLLASYQWDRPINMLNQGGDLNIGIKDYLTFEGFSTKLIPIKNKITQKDPGFVDTDDLYEIITKNSFFDAISRDDYYIDYQNLYTFLGAMSLRNLFVTSATAFIKAGETDRAIEMLNMSRAALKPSRFPYDNAIYGWASNALFPMQMVVDYYTLNHPTEAKEVAEELYGQLSQSVKYYLNFYADYKEEFEYSCNLVYYLIDEIKQAGDTELANKFDKDFASMVESLTSQE